MDKYTTGLDALLDKTDVSRLAERITGHFFSEENDLNTLMISIGVDSVEDLLSRMLLFFDKHLNLIDRPAVEETDLLQLTMAFVKEAGLAWPMGTSARDVEQMQGTIYKLGRVFIHRLIFPELIKANPNLAYSVKNLLSRFVRDICTVEGLNHFDIQNLLKLDEIVIPFPKERIVGVKTRLKYRQIKDEFLELRELSEAGLRKLARELKTDYAAISSVPRFCSLFNSRGEDFEPLDISEKKLPLIVHLIYRMRNPYSAAHKPLIGMNKGKAIWQFLQENLTVNGNTYGRELAKISSEINDPHFPDKHQIKIQVRELLNQFYQSPKK